MNATQITDMKTLNRERTKAHAQLADATKAAKRERGLAVIEDRKPSKRVLDAPGKLEDVVAALELRAEELPYELHAAEMKRREANAEDAAEKLAAVEAKTPEIEAEYEAKAEASNAASRQYGATLDADDKAVQERAERELSRARQARRRHRDSLDLAKTRADLAAERLEDLEKTDPEGYAA